MDTWKNSLSSTPNTRHFNNRDEWVKNFPLLSLIKYHPPLHNRQTRHTKSIRTVGIDSEADRQGNTFLWCTSEGDVFADDEMPRRLFSRKYLQTNFVVWNLKYEMGAILKRLPLEHLEELRTLQKTEWGGYKYSVIGEKSLTISRGRNSCHFYDIFPFYLSSLDNAAHKYLKEAKHESDPELYYDWFIRKYHSHIVEYCIRDAVLTNRLCRLIIDSFEGFGVFPQKLYSTAYVSWQYFRTHCKYVHVKHFYDRRPEVLEFAMRAYNGGKFEVTSKGPAYYYEYDIVSAYPYEIANLVDISMARVLRSAEYVPEASYSILLCDIIIDPRIPNPSPVQTKGLNIYPAGRLQRWIHKCEYEYFVESGCGIRILDGVHLIIKRKTYPYRAEIEKLMRYKHEYKMNKDAVRYQLVKIVMNSFYGKMVQLTQTPNGIRAGAAWNPVYGGHITAACRVRITKLQRDFPAVCAVHTDSIISTDRIDTELSALLGGLDFECEGNGVLLGSGIYQIGDKTRVRGFPTKRSLIDLIPESGSAIKYERNRPFGWREVTFRKLDPVKINYFATIEKEMSLNFDRKRIWLKDWNDYSEVLQRRVHSVPRVVIMNSPPQFVA